MLGETIRFIIFIPKYGWYCREFICTNDGQVLKKKEYWIGNDQAFAEYRKVIKQK